MDAPLQFLKEEIVVRSDAEREELLRRIKEWNLLTEDHPELPRIYQYDEKLLHPLTESSICAYTIIWFKSPGLSLHEEFCRQNVQMSDIDLLDCVKQLSALLRATHQIGIPILDIRPGNIFLQKPPEATQAGTVGPIYTFGRWFLGMFSLESYDLRSFLFLPPEVDHPDLGKPDTASDVYMLAATLYKLYSGHGIFGETETTYARIRWQHRWEEPDLTDLPPQFHPLFREALAKDPAERPSIEKFRDRFEQAYREMIPGPPRVDTLAETAAFIKAVAGKPMTRRTAIALMVMISLLFLAVLFDNLGNLLQGAGKPKKKYQVSSQVGTERYIFNQHEARVKVALPSPDGSKLLSTDESGRVIVSKIDSQELILDDSLRYEGVPVASAAWAPDGQTFATLGQNGLVRLWQLQGDEYTPIKGRDYHPIFPSASKIAWSSRGDFVVTSGCYVLVYRDVLRKGFLKQPLVYKGHSDTVTCVTLSPDGKTALSGSEDMTAQVWNVETGQLIATTGKDFDQPISAVAFSPDGRYIGIGSENKSVQVRNAQQFYLLFPYNHNGPVTDLGFSDDSLYIASGGDDQVIQIYGLNHNQLFAFKGHHANVTTVKWISPKVQLGPGEWIVSSSGTDIIVWRGR